MKIKSKTRKVVTTRNGVTKHFVVYQRGELSFKVQVSPDFDENEPMLEGLWKANRVDIMYALNILVKEGYHPDDLVAAVAAYVQKSRNAPNTVRMMHDATKEYLAEIRDTHDYKTWQVYDRAVGAFQRHVGHETCVDEITRLHVSTYFGSFKGSRRTHNSHLRRVKSFANWCVRKGYMPDANAFLATVSLPVEAKEPEYIKGEDMEQIIDACNAIQDFDLRNNVRLYIVLSFFFGIRSAELLHLTNDSIVCDEGATNAEGIRIGRAKGASHGRRGRFVPAPTKELEEYLACVKQAGWFEGFDASFYKQVSKLFDKTGVPKPSNIGRHSYITYHVAMFGDEQKTVTSAGTSHEMAASHYKGIASKKEAEDYFLRLASRLVNPSA